MKRYAGASSDIDMRVEVGLVSSNILITAADGPSTYLRGSGSNSGGELFGACILVAGNASARISNLAVTYGGQAGLLRPSVLFQVRTGVVEEDLDLAWADIGSTICVHL